MSKIAIMSTYYLGAATANGICAQNIVNELHNMGHSIEVICYKDIGSSDVPCNIHTMDTSKSDGESGIYRIARKVRKGTQLVVGNIGAALDKGLVKRYYCQLEKIYSTENIDAVIAMFFPLEAAEALYLFKKAHPDIKAIIYEVDSIGDGIGQRGVKSLYTRMYEKWLNRVYRLIDAVFVMQSHDAYWKATFGQQNRSKLKLVDLPMLQERKCTLEKHENTDAETSLIYAGLIEKKYRSPSYLLSVLRELDKKMAFRFAFYSKGDCENEISQIAGEVRGICQKGYVPAEELDKAMDNADFLVSIGNSVSRSVPSKVVNYISYGKPIIHFSSQKEDVCKEYFEKYPLALVVDQSLPIEQSSKLVYEFIQRTKGKTLEFERIEKVFPLNSPRYSAELISKAVEKDR